MDNVVVDVWLPSNPDLHGKDDFSERSHQMSEAIKAEAATIEADNSIGAKKIIFNPVYGDKPNWTQEAIAAIIFGDMYYQNVPPSKRASAPELAISTCALDQRENQFRWFFSAQLTGFAISQYVLKNPSRHYVLVTMRSDLGNTIRCGIKEDYRLNGLVDFDDALDYVEYAQEDRNAEEYERVMGVLSSKETQEVTGRISVILVGYGSIYEKILWAFRRGEKFKDWSLIVESNYTVFAKALNKEHDDNKGCNLKTTCVSGLLTANENVFESFCRDSVRLIYHWLFSVNDPDDTDEGRRDEFLLYRQSFSHFLRNLRFYNSPRIGSVSFRDDGELFVPFFTYNALCEERSPIEKCTNYCHDIIVKEDGADQLRKATLEFEKLEDYRAIPRDLKLDDKKFDEVKKTFAAFSSLIGKIPNALRMCYLSNFQATEKVFYRWSSIQKDAFDDKIIIACGHLIDQLVRLLNGSNRTLQINLHDTDLENNDVSRIYIVSHDFNVLCFDAWLNVIKNKIDRSVGLACLESFVREYARAIICSSTYNAAQKALKEFKSLCNRKRTSKSDLVWHSSDGTSSLLNLGLINESKDTDQRSESGFKAFTSLTRLATSIVEIVDQARFIYYIPSVCGDRNTQGGVVMLTKFKLTLFDLQILSNSVSMLFAIIKSSLTLQDSQLAAIQSAIGSIMSRNGSHNIGSHVLAALSHNVGTMPDDRVLYQYIQHRMDYIATATTDQPSWRQPTMFVASLMKEFLRQKHLLDFISSSEGLHAYQFQGQTVEESQVNTIQLHIRRIIVPDENVSWEKVGFLDDKNSIVDFVTYKNQGDDSGTIDFSRDIAVAIPGGVIGQHAFYTILENILRNAAKHEWAEVMRVCNVAVEVLGEEECNRLFGDYRPKCLDVYIDFKDNRKSGNVEVRIWNDRVASVANTAQIEAFTICRQFQDRQRIDDAVASVWNRYQVLDEQRKDMCSNPVFCLVKRAVESIPKEHRSSLKEIYQAIKEQFKKSPVVSVDDYIVFLEASMTEKVRCQMSGLEGKIRQSFINQHGTLRKENWGIAEMRISAGFLRCCEIGHVGGLPGAGKPLDIIRPVLVENANHDNCIGYRFDIEKPKLLLVVLDSAECDIEATNLVAAQFGIKFVLRQKLDVNVAYPYSYVLFESLNKVQVDDLKSKKFALPFRALCYTFADKDSMLEKFVPKYIGAFFNDTAVNIKKIDSDPISSAQVCHTLLEEVYADWLCHVRSRGLRRGDHVALDIDGGGTVGGTAQTLISRTELLAFVFTNTFNTAIRSFLQENGPDDVMGSIVSRCEDGVLDVADGASDGEAVCGEDCGLDAGAVSVEDREMPGGHVHISSMPTGLAALLYAIAEMPRRQVALIVDLVRRFPDRKDALCTDVKAIVECQLILWIEQVLGGGKTVELHYGDLAGDSSFDSRWIQKFRGERSIYVGDIDELERNQDCCDWMGRFVNYICSVILDQADSFLRKYEERFTTLPKAFKMESGEGQQRWAWKIGERLVEEVVISSDPKVRAKEKADGAICYFRHGDESYPQIGDFYYEPMSGAQGTLNTFIKLRKEILNGVASTDARCWVAGFVTRIVENAASRVLIIDERVTKFMRDHQDVGGLMGGLRLAVADNNDSGVMDMFSHFSLENPPVFAGVKLTDFEIVIIHQGVIDKLLPGHEDKKVVEAWLNQMINCLHYVVITTGRGTPANIPDSARVLPYSVIESSILQRYPEKMILVDAVMNILPVRNKKGV